MVQIPCRSQESDVTPYGLDVDGHRNGTRSQLRTQESVLRITSNGRITICVEYQDLYRGRAYRVTYHGI